MRLLHTSDWHLGQYFMGRTRQAEHQAFLGWLLEQVRLHQVDAVLVAGDVFDTGTPPSHARELYYDFILSMHEVGVQLVVQGGNHDSVATLNESRRLLERLGTHIIPRIDDDPESQLIVLRDGAGQPGAILCVVPYIRPRDVLQGRAGQSAEDKQLALQQAIAAHYADLHERAEQRAQALGGLPIISSGHLLSVGASRSESVREIYVGSLDAFPTNAFPAADYIALGHIHRAQKVGGLEHIRYSGSPLALSFDEAAQEKVVLLVDLDAAGLRSVTPLAVPCFQVLASLRGDLASLPEQLRTVAQRGCPTQPVWLELVVSLDTHLPDLAERVQALVEGLPVEVLRVRRERTTLTTDGWEAGVQLQDLDTLEVFEQRLAEAGLADALCAELRVRYREILAELEDA